MSPRTEIPIREASDPPDDVDIWQRWTVGIGHGQPRRGADADFRYGSNSEVAAIANHVCSTPNNRHLRLERTLPFRANFGSDGTTP